MEYSINFTPSSTSNFAGSQIYGSTINNSGLKRMPNYINEPSVFETPNSHRSIVSACRSLYVNNGIVRGAIELKSFYSIGSAFKLFSMCDSVKERANYSKYLYDWQNVACVDGRSFNDLLYNISEAIDVDGDCFVLLTKSNQGFPQLQFIRSNRVHGDESSLKNTKFSKYTVSDGIVINDRGFEVAYIIDGNSVISSKSMLHIKDTGMLSTLRGTPLFAHAIKTFRFIDDIVESELTAGKIASQIALIETNKAGGVATDLNNLYTAASGGDSTKIETIGNGQILYFQAGSNASVDTLKFERPSVNFQAFKQQLLREALSGANIPYELVVTPDSTGTGIRAALSKFDRCCKDRTLLLKRFAKLITDYVLAVAIERGDLIYSKGWYNVYITEPTKPSIDLGRDSAAMINEYNNGLRTLENCISGLDLTVEEFANVRANELAIMEKARLEANEKFGVEISSEAMRKI